ncbi:hypothetical protein [Methylobacterium nigriterrae]|uniref:hypothetical protein n=1 Tax=Methylobacterium nigriterrae TaxID=3127512 RepID=UPI0030139DC2
MTVLFGLVVFVLMLAVLASKGRPTAFLGCLCLLGLGCVIALSSFKGIVRAIA